MFKFDSVPGTSVGKEVLKGGEDGGNELLLVPMSEFRLFSSSSFNAALFSNSVLFLRSINEAGFDGGTNDDSNGGTNDDDSNGGGDFGPSTEPEIKE